MFDVGQQKDMLRATGNCPHRAPELQGAAWQPGEGKKKWGVGGGKAARSKPSSEKLLATTVTIYRVFISRSVDGSSSPQGYSGLPSSFSPHTHTNAVLLCAPEEMLTVP